MNMPILATKLYVPLSRTKVVPRPRLIEQLNEGLNRKLTLVSASAGFGKTTLVGDWIAGCERPAAWLSLDQGDNDAKRFLSHFVAALQTIEESFGRGSVNALQSPQPPSTETILTMLLNDISAYPHPFVLVLDDYHQIDAEWLGDSITFLLDHLPAQMHLVITTRENPQLPLGRLRVRGHLSELREADLRFTPDEAAAFLNQAMGLNLTADEMTALETRTEGWIAGLQLAALSMKGHKDIPSFIREFAGDNRYIMDYLAEEVLQRQPESIRSFLLQTSILDRLHGPLCDAVTGQEEGHARLELLERGSFFVVPLDDRRRWYRYHHLFAEVLLTHLRADHPGQVANLHQRASVWYEQNGMAADAIRHSLAAEDFARSADLVELAIPALRKSRDETAMMGWLQAIPDELIRFRPVLCAWYAGALLGGGKLEAVENRLRDAERWLIALADESDRQQALSAGMVVLDEEEFRRLPGLIAVYRAGLALVRGDVPAVQQYARKALVLVPEDDDLPRGAATALLGLASWRSGDLEEARRMFAEGMIRVTQAGSISDAINGANAIADIWIAKGRLREAMRTYERGLQLAVEHGDPALRGTADILVGMSDIHRERNELHAAEQNLLKSKEQGEHTGFPQFRYRWSVSMSRLREAQGDLNGALDLLLEAESLFTSDFFLDVRPMAALKTRLWIRQGRLGEALDWVREKRLTVQDDLSYAREFEHITLARVLLAQYKTGHADHSLREALGLLERLLQEAEAGGRAGSMIEILVVEAIAHHMLGDTLAAVRQLEHALTLAEPEGYVRIFADEGQPIAILLEAAAKQGIAPDYVRRLLAIVGKADTLREPRTKLLKGPLREPLSERERDVLRLLATDLGGPDIARELIVSLNTLRTHTKNIYDKLEVNSRREAVRRAAELDLI